jgi:hypothetical protein
MRRCCAVDLYRREIRSMPGWSERIGKCYPYDQNEGYTAWTYFVGAVGSPSSVQFYEMFHLSMICR